jgi:hypothetical protein
MGAYKFFQIPSGSFEFKIHIARFELIIKKKKNIFFHSSFIFLYVQFTQHEIVTSYAMIVINLEVRKLDTNDLISVCRFIVKFNLKRLNSHKLSMSA